MNITYVLKCGDCPLYLPRLCGPGGSSPLPEQCTHPDANAVPPNLTLGGPEVMPHKCPMLKQPMVYKAALQRKPK